MQSTRTIFSGYRAVIMGSMTDRIGSGVVTSSGSTWTAKTEIGIPLTVARGSANALVADSGE